jgi:hypothetical protein
MMAPVETPCFFLVWNHVTAPLPRGNLPVLNEPNDTTGQRNLLAGQQWLDVALFGTSEGLS